MVFGHDSSPRCGEVPGKVEVIPTSLPELPEPSRTPRKAFWGGRSGDCSYASQRGGLAPSQVRYRHNDVVRHSGMQSVNKISEFVNSHVFPKRPPCCQPGNGKSGSQTRQTTWCAGPREKPKNLLYRTWSFIQWIRLIFIILIYPFKGLY